MTPLWPQRMQWRCLGETGLPVTFVVQFCLIPLGLGLSTGQRYILWEQALLYAQAISEKHCAQVIAPKRGL